MAAPRTYLDYNATAPLRAAAVNACLSALGIYGNPSSIHREGQAARALIEEARRWIARLLGAPAERITFTSGGTEGANLVLAPSLASRSAPDGV
jgi:cysteine desulfurase